MLTAGSATAAQEVVTRLGRALHAYGSPAHRLEEALSAVARSLGLEASFFASPTSLLVSFGRGRERRTVLERVEPGGQDLEKLVANIVVR